MATDTNTTPSPAGEDRSRLLSLEDAVHDVHSSTRILELALEGTIEATDTLFSPMILAAVPHLAGYRIFVLTGDQLEGLSAALALVRERADHLYARFYEEASKPKRSVA